LNAANVNEAGTVTATGSFTDPAPQDLHTVVLNWGGGSAPTEVARGGGVRSFRGTHTYLDDGPFPGNGTPSATETVTAKVTDDGGASGSGTTTVTVNNVAPTNVQVSFSSPTIDEGGTATVTGSFTDPGTQDLHTVVIDWGDGSA